MPIKNIKASPNNGSDGPKALRIRTAYPDAKTSYGNFDDDDEQKWIFAEEKKPLIGLYGVVGANDKIEQMGFITLNVEC